MPSPRDSRVKRVKRKYTFRWDSYYIPCPYCGLMLGQLAMERFGMVKHLCPPRGGIVDTGQS